MRYKTPLNERTKSLTFSSYAPAIIEKPQRGKSLLPQSLQKGYVHRIGGNSPKTKKAPTYTKREKRIIVIDPGHGGMDPGAIGKSGVREKDITLAYARSLKATLENTGRFKAYLTRSSDKYINLHTRVTLAQKFNADLMISLHADSHSNPNTRGLSVYTLSEDRAKREAKKLVQKADHKTVVSGVDLRHQEDDVQHMVITMSQRHTTNTSSRFAEILVEEMGNDTKLLKNTHRHRSFAVLTGVDVPTALIELGFLSNRYEEKMLNKTYYKKRLIQGISDAVTRFFNEHPAL